MITEDLLKDWRQFQLNRRKRRVFEMAAINEFNCTIMGLVGDIPLPGKINIFNNDIKFTCGKLKANFGVDQFRGFNEDENLKRISLTLRNEAEPPIELQFANLITFEAALMAIENVLSERVNLPTPPSSSSSSSDEEINN